MVGFASIPSWLDALLGEKFFNACLAHEEEKKNEENSFCLDCCIGFCPHCLPSHQAHRILQIRRYVYKDVLRLKDAEKLMDCSKVQPYRTNGEKVVFLAHRPIREQQRSSDNICILCDRNLQRPYLHCSIYCKVHHMGISQIEGKEQNFTSEVDKSQVTSIGTSSKSSSSADKVDETATCRGLSSIETTEVVKGKCSSASVASRTPEVTNTITIAEGRHRRKGVPHRSALF